MSFSENEGVIDFLDIQGRKITVLGQAYTYLCILTLGILHIFCKIFPNFKTILVSKKCKLKYADSVIIINKYRKVEFRYLKFYKIPAPLCKNKSLVNFIDNNQVKVLDTEYGRFIFNYPHNRFVISKYILNKKDSLKNILDRKFLIENEQEALFCKEILYGRNTYNLRLPSILNIFIDTTFNLTVFINIFCIILWIRIDYKLYACFISAFFAYGYFQEILREINLKYNLENAQNSKLIMAFRNKKFELIESSEIFPGDIICIKPCLELFCDVALLKGDVISDESFLTGESVPICKSAALRSVVYSGTSILKSVSNVTPFEDINSESLHRVINLIQTDSLQNGKSGYAIGVVIGIGFNTLRGKIMKDIINPKPVFIEFLTQAFLNIAHLVYISFFASISIFIYLKFILVWDTDKCWNYTLDLFFSLAPPTLYASLSIGIQISNNNLRHSEIYCNNLDRIYTASNVDMAIFDKTGTLTSDGMELTYIDDCRKYMKDISEVDDITRIGLSACHSVYELEGKYSGDTLDIQMFIFSQSTLEYDDNNIRNIKIGYVNLIEGPFLKEFDNENELLFYENTKNRNVISNNIIYSGTISSDTISSDTIINLNSDDLNCDDTKDTYFSNNRVKNISILNTVDFTSESRMMSVVVKDGYKKYYFCKGSPDKIASLLKVKPDNYDERVRDHSLNGYRVISLAYREEGLEELIFLCFIVFSNKLKPESISVIKELKSAEIGTNICTGDNILTAISVGRECGIIEENTTVIFPVLPDNCKSVYEMEWVCLGDGDLFFDKVKLSIYKNNYKEFSDDFVIACEGKEYDFLSKTYYKSFILEKGRIFARFNPAQKKALVEDFRNLNRNVLFCGDGANDSGAIGTADVGIALAQNEASLASSFCARNINAVPLLIKECRNAYVTSIARYRFVLMTGLLVYFNLVFLVCRNKFFSDMQSIHIDILLIFTITFYLSKFNKSDILSIKKPALFNSNMSLTKNILTISSLLLLNLGVCLLEDKLLVFSTVSKSATYLFFITTFQVIFLGLVVSDCAPFREEILQNKTLLRVSCGLGGISLVLLGIAYFRSSCYQFSSINYQDIFLIIGFIILSGMFSVGIYLYNRNGISSTSHTS